MNGGGFDGTIIVELHVWQPKRHGMPSRNYDDFLFITFEEGLPIWLIDCWQPPGTNQSQCFQNIHAKLGREAFPMQTKYIINKIILTASSWDLPLVVMWFLSILLGTTVCMMIVAFILFQFCFLLRLLCYFKNKNK